MTGTSPPGCELLAPMALLFARYPVFSASGRGTKHPWIPRADQRVTRSGSLDDDALFHHERDMLRTLDVRQWIAWDRDDVGELSFLEHTDLVGHPEQLGVRGGRGAE